MAALADFRISTVRSGWRSSRVDTQWDHVLPRAGTTKFLFSKSLLGVRRVVTWFVRSTGMLNCSAIHLSVAACFTKMSCRFMMEQSCFLVELAMESTTTSPVSYTHLRAHETPEHLVCRLLLEKKKKYLTSTQITTIINTNTNLALISITL
eukprot:TRINITY_DN57170_c0_g1_i1.p1 TRINITY_DN57170_c0_g1~~TRINITY_DN57170_c0_g1_i1.p1  ORF type:complete len:151 (+),score=19.80 TRINITY_DN57170_c0_g1_i1:630-1082(+)